MKGAQEVVLAVLGSRAVFQVLVWDKESGKARLMSRMGAEFVAELADFPKFGYTLTKALRVERDTTAGGALYMFVKPDGKPFPFPNGQF